MRLSSILFSILITFSAVAQTTQTGTIKEYNEKAKKTPLEGVELNVRSANNTVSDKNGDFTLQFLTLKPGEKVNVRRIEKLGYEIFNKEAIEQWNINPKNSFVIIMCRSDKFKKIRDNYEKVSSESYARQLKKEEAALSKLKEQGKLKEEEYQKQLYELRETYEKQLDNLDNYIDRFSRIDLSELSAVEQEIIALVQEGKIDEAIAKYEQQNYVDKYTKEVAEIKEVSSAIDRLSEVKQSKEAFKDSLLGAINRQIETLKLAGGKDNFEKILNIYESLISSEDIDANIAIAYLGLLNQVGMFNRAIEIYDTRIRNSELPLHYKEKILVQIGNSYNQLQNLNNAIDYYQQALAIIEKNDSINSHYIRQRRNAILGNLGLAFLRKADYQNALSFFNQCAPQLEDFEGVETEIKRLNNLGILYRITNNCQSADSVLNLGINLCLNFNVYNNEQKKELNSTLASLYQGKGNAYCQINDFDSAQHSYEKSLNILKNLFEYNPRTYGTPLATMYYNYGRMFRMQEDKIEQSVAYYKEALNLYESILKDHFVQRLFDNYSETFSNLALVYDKLNYKEECIQLCNRASNMLDLCKDYPYKAAILLSDLGTIYSNIKMYEESLNYYLHAEDAIAPMYLEYPGIYSIHLARLYCNIGTQLCEMDRYSESKEYFSKSISLYNELVGNNTIYESDRKDALNKAYLSLVLSPEYKEGLKYLRKLQLLEPSNYKYKENEIIFLYGNGEKEEAINVFQDFINSHPDYPKDSPLYKEMSKIIENPR